MRTTGTAGHAGAMSGLPSPERRSLTVESNLRLGAYRIIRCSDSEGPLPQPGQFYMLSLEGLWGGPGGRPFLSRAISVMRMGEGWLEFAIEIVGPGTDRLCGVSEGDSLDVLGPLGNGFDLAISDECSPLIVGGGIGIAPLVAVAEVFTSAPVLLGFRDSVYAQASSLFREPEIATDDGSVGHAGRVTELLLGQLAKTKYEVLACGPPAMLDSVAQLCQDLGVRAQIAVEAPMACGFGACYGCVVPTVDGYRRACVDGPVFGSETYSPQGVV